MHKLRVAIRRALATLKVFAQFWEHKKAKRLRKKLRRLARVCGRVRDCDIALALLQESGSTDAAVASVNHRRKRRLRKLTEAIEEWRGHRILTRWCTSPPFVLDGEGEWSGKESAWANASRVLPERCELVALTGNRALRSTIDYKQLHRFRLAVKEVRYILELFEGLGGANVRRLLRSARLLQDGLGAVNDCVTAACLVLGFERDELRIRTLAETRTRAVVDLWTEDFVSRWRNHARDLRPRIAPQPMRRSSSA